MSIHIEHSSSQVVSVDEDGSGLEGVFDKIVEQVMHNLEEMKEAERRAAAERRGDPPREHDGTYRQRVSITIEYIAD